jgi:hypothetical protein
MMFMAISGFGGALDHRQLPGAVRIARGASVFRIWGELIFWQVLKFDHTYRWCTAHVRKTRTGNEAVGRNSTLRKRAIDYQ